MGMNQMHKEASSDKCYAIVKLVMLLLVLLDFASCPMFVIVLKFLKRRCGDFLYRERQFSVDFSSDDEGGEDDDFTIGSSSWNRARASTARSAADSEESSFSSERQKGGGLPGHWGKPNTKS